jgi:transposase InsO family protein
MANQELFKRIEVVYNENHGIYASPRIYHELDDQGVSGSENRVARLMRLRGPQAKQTKRFKTTTERHQAAPVTANLLDQIRNGWRTSHTSLPWKDGSTWPLSWICTRGASSAGRCRIG